MKDICLKVQAIKNAPKDAFTYAPTDITIRIDGLTDDMKNCRLYAETVSDEPVEPPYLSKRNVTQSVLLFPYEQIAAAFDDDGNVIPEVANQLLGTFNMQIRP